MTNMFLLFHTIQSAPEILRDGLCPAMLMPSKACKWETSSSSKFTRSQYMQLCLKVCCFCVKWNKQLHELSSPSAVTRRCLPALGTRKKNGVVVVGNETTIDTGEGTTVNATDVLEASKWVIVWQRITCTHKICQRYKNVNQSDCVVVNMLWNDQEMVLKCIYRYINLMISD